jgi:hypothetical protein
LVASWLMAQNRNSKSKYVFWRVKGHVYDMFRLSRPCD